MFTGAATQCAAQRKDPDQSDSVRGRGHYCTIAMVLTFKLTADIAEVKVSIHQRGPIVEVLGHVVQPVGLHPFDPVVAVLDLQRNLDCVVLHVCVPDWRVVVQSQQLRSCWDATEKNIQNMQKSPLQRTESRRCQVTAVYSRARFTPLPFWALSPSLLHRKDSTITGKRSRNLLQLQEMIQPFHQSRMSHHSFLIRQTVCFSLFWLPVWSIPLGWSEHVCRLDFFEILVVRCGRWCWWFVSWHLRNLVCFMCCCLSDFQLFLLTCTGCYI